jgi:hypothetical protein
MGATSLVVGPHIDLCPALATTAGTLASRLSRLAAVELHEARLACSQPPTPLAGSATSLQAQIPRASHADIGPQTALHSKDSGGGWGLNAGSIASSLNWELVPSGLAAFSAPSVAGTGYTSLLGSGSTADVVQPSDQRSKAGKQLQAVKGAQQGSSGPVQAPEWASHLGDGFPLVYEMDVLQQVRRSSLYNNQKSATVRLQDMS